MIQDFVDRFMASKDLLRQKFKEKWPDSYIDVVRATMQVIHDSIESNRGSTLDIPDPERVAEVDFGEYQGTLVYIIGETYYQPSTHWVVSVGYGSCSGCDTLEDLRDRADVAFDVGASTWTKREVPLSEAQEKAYDGLVTLALHIVQEMKEI